MSGGSLKELVKTLSTALSTPQPLYPLSEDVLEAIEAYLDKHIEIDDHDSQRLHDELLSLHIAKVQNNSEKHATFLACFRILRPALVGVERLLKWWEILVKPTFDSMGQAKAVVSDARAIVLSVLAYDEDDDPTDEKARASAVFTDKLFEVFLEKTKLLSFERGTGFREEQRQRFVCANVEAVLLAFGKRRPKLFLEKIDAFVVQKEYRLQILGLLCSFVRLQGPHLYQILQTPLLDHLLQCLENDTSTTVISLALTVLIMFMPHLCNSLAVYLPRLFVVYTRVLCWDKFGVVRLEEPKSGKDIYSRAGSPLSCNKADGPTNDSWQKLDSSFETASSTTPDVSDFFTFLYGLYPINFLTFIREPYKFLERSEYKDVDQLDIEEDTIRQRTEHYRQLHILHPNFLSLTAETELSDQSRWMKVEPADVTAQCIGLVCSNIPLGSTTDSRTEDGNMRPELPEALIPTEDIPSESLLSSEEDRGYLDDTSNDTSDNSTYSWKEAGNSAGHLSARGPPGCHSRGSPHFPPREMRTPDSPTIPHTTVAPSEGEARLQDMLHLQETLRASLHDASRIESGPLPPPPGPPPSAPPPGYGSVTASPRLDAYVNSLSQKNMPRSPALRPASSDTQGTIAFLQREVMLLKNDLNFERYLKQQHLSHIGHLQRKHIKESTAEAETQNLINTNKSLRAKLEEAKKAYSASRQEALKSKNQAKKWEAELSAKIRTLREEQKAWRADEEATKQALQTAREEADHLRKLLTENEAEGLRNRQKLQAMASEMEEVNKLRTFVDHLSSKLAEYEARAEEFEMQRHSEDAAVAQVDRMKMRLTSREQESQKMRRGYETKINELESRINSLSNPMPPSPNSGFQVMIDSAMSVSDSRLSSLKKAHNHLLSKYTELEIKYIELQAAQEIDNLPARQSSSGQQSPPQQYHELQAPLLQSDSETSQNFGRRTTMYHQSEGSLSPHSASYPESAKSGNSGGSYRTMPLPPTSSHSQHSQHSQSAPNTSTATSPVFPTYSNSNSGKFPPPSQDGSVSEHQHSQYQHQDFPNPPLRHKVSMQESLSPDSHSLRTVTSTTSSEWRKEKKSPTEVRMRGRGGVQNIIKKDKDKDEGENGEEKVKKKKKSKFPTGSGLAGIRGFV